jgi:hypothetical protein
MKDLIVLLVACIVLVLCVCIYSVNAAEISIGYSPFSYHVDRPDKNDDINENPNGIGVSYNGWSIVTFENSFFNRSWFLGKQFKWKEWSNNSLFWGINIYAGILKGYDNDFNVGGWSPAVAPTFEFGKGHYSLETSYMPTIHGGVFVGMLKYTF